MIAFVNKYLKPFSSTDTDLHAMYDQQSMLNQMEDMDFTVNREIFNKWLEFDVSAFGYYL